MCSRYDSFFKTLGSVSPVQLLLTKMPSDSTRLTVHCTKENFYLVSRISVFTFLFYARNSKAENVISDV